MPWPLTRPRCRTNTGLLRWERNILGIGLLGELLLGRGLYRRWGGSSGGGGDMWLRTWCSLTLSSRERSLLLLYIHRLLGSSHNLSLLLLILLRGRDSRCA